MILPYKNLFSKNNLLNLLLSLIPLSYIAGNLIINVNIILIIFTTFFFFRGDVLNFKFNFLDKLIFFFFIYILINGFYNNFFNFNSNIPEKNFILFKSILYLKYLFFYISVRYLLKINIINFKILFITFGLSALFVNIDIFIQYIFGKDLFGYEATARRLPGPFGKEYIAGSYLQKFSFFLISYLIIFHDLKKKIYFDISLLCLITIISLGLILAGNRVPLLLFLIMLSIGVFFQKELRKTFLIYVSIIFIALVYLVNSSRDYHSHYTGFVKKSFQISIYLKEKINNRNVDLWKFGATNLHIKEIETGFQTFKLNPILGGGLRSFYINCAKINSKALAEVNRLGGCNSHPHNYYLQLAAEIGLIGVILATFIFLLIILNIFKLLINSNFNDYNKSIIMPFFLLFIVEVFPFKSTGNFFTTGNSTFLFFIIAFLISLSEYKTIKND